MIMSLWKSFDPMKNNTTLYIASWYTSAINLGDPRVKNWPLMGTPTWTLLITLAYVLMCNFLPKYMQTTKPLQLTKVLLIYNSVIILTNLYIAFELYPAIATYSWTCEPVFYGIDDKSIRTASALWLYYISKLVEMLDSAFFILRKKESQLTFLHIYHHSSIFCLWWIGVNYVAGGSSVFGAFFNALVHVLMYLYYFIAALGQEYKKYLGWKKYLTVIQIVQFLLAIVMGLNAIKENCEFPKWMQYAMIFYMFSFVVLFSKFYYRQYVKHKHM